LKKSVFFLTWVGVAFSAARYLTGGDSWGMISADTPDPIMQDMTKNKEEMLHESDY